MARIIRTELISALTPEMLEGATLITLRASPVTSRHPSLKLPRLATDILKKKGFDVASGILARHTLKKVIAGSFPGSDTASLHSHLRNALRIVLRTGIDPEKLIESGSASIRQLGIIARAYKETLRAQNLIDDDEVLWAASLANPEPSRLVVYGHHRARKEEVHFINAAAGDGSIYFLPCGDDPIFKENRAWAQYLVSKGWQLSSDVKIQPTEVGPQLALRFAGLNPGPTSKVDAKSYPDIDAEVRGVLSSVKQLVVEGADPGAIAVVVRDPALYAHTVSAVADEYGLPVRMRHRIQIGSTAFGGFVRLLLESIGNDFQFEVAVRMAMHPFGPQLSIEKLAEVRRQHPAGLEKWKLICPEIADLQIPDEASVSGWAGILNATFVRLGVPGRAAVRTVDSIAFSGFMESLREIERLDGRRVMNFNGFAALTGELLTEETAPMRPGSAGVAIAEPKDLVGTSFEHLFILGLAEGIYPRPPSEDPAVDFFERKRLAVQNIDFASAAEVARWEGLSFFSTLLAAQGRVSFSYPKIVDKNEVIESSFFKRLGVKTVPPAGGAIFASSVEELRKAELRHSRLSLEDDVRDHARRQYEVEFRRETSPLYDQYDGVIGVAIDPGSRTWSASQIMTIGQCSFGWFSQRILGLAPVEEMDLGLEARTLGLLFHKTLEIAVRRAKSDPDIREGTLRHLEDAFAEAEKDEKVGLPSLPGWEVERLAHLRDLRKAVASPEFIMEGAEVVDVEVEFRGNWEGFKVKGTIDRVDRTEDGLIAIDYKTGGQTPKGAKDRSGKLTVDVQIPLYAGIALPTLYPSEKMGTSAYYSITKGKILRSEKPGDREKLAGLADDLRQILETGSFAIDPDDAEHACRFCEYKHICRKGPRLRRKSRA